MSESTSTEVNSTELTVTELNVSLRHRFLYMSSHLPAMSNPNVTLGERLHALHLFGGHASWEGSAVATADASADASADDEACPACVLTKRAGEVLGGSNLGAEIDRRFGELTELKTAGGLESLEDMNRPEVSEIFDVFTTFLDAICDFCYKVKTRKRPFRSLFQEPSSRDVVRGRVHFYTDQELSDHLVAILDNVNEESSVRQELIEHFQHFLTRALRQESGRGRDGRSQSRGRSQALKYALRKRAVGAKMDACRLCVLREDLESGCVVCQEGVFEVGVAPVRLDCGHTYHEECIVPWLLRQADTCPVCRKKVL